VEEFDRAKTNGKPLDTENYIKTRQKSEKYVTPELKYPFTNRLFYWNCSNPKTNEAS
jgi:hypothetical protein